MRQWGVLACEALSLVYVFLAAAAAPGQVLLMYLLSRMQSAAVGRARLRVCAR